MATLVSVNVGLPTDVQWQGRVVHTGVFKRPVSGPQMVRRLNIDGDGQGDLGGHGGEQRAVLIYQTESYRYWAQVLKRDDLEPGHFGENFTVDGLPDDEVCIGDRYRIGDAVFEVTQPRVTCYRVGIRLDEPRMAALLVSHHRPGFYCRVLQEGFVEPGQTITKISADPEAMSVNEIDALLYLPGHPRESLQRALRIPALSPGWQASLRSLLDQTERDGVSGNSGLSAAAGTPSPAWPGFRSLIVSDIKMESDSVFSVVLADPDGAPLASWLAGQSIALRIHIDGDHLPIYRNYSLSNRPGDPDYRIAIKQERAGVASGYLHSHLRVGDRLEVAAARGGFYLGDGDGPVVLISAGVGITPVLAMLHAISDSQPDRRVWWVHAARDGSEHPFTAETAELLGRLSNVEAHVAYSRPGVASHFGVDYTIKGRLTAESLSEMALPREADVYVCGPESFMRDMTAALTATGIEPARIHTETFGAQGALAPGVVAAAAPPPHLPAGPAGTGPEVSFSRSGITAKWSDRYPSLLDFAEACDVPVRWSCRTGVCHNCESALLAGTVHYDPDPVESAADGNALICCSRPTSAVVLDL
ncbi:flavodoxin reductase family protein [Mycobacterium sp. JS623]|uniref:MOSC and FAD-binding oxidoreductase domain-containing protein n=1 Tax=Mycobacterium sp. JS623 TaxID=212767 RepID=UPI0002A55BEA|nr:MOSC and FAD-binding oxidoreductase domain-containing protein [Mycobacterium sp. JS623]AGB25343.1 flavodoxin reductase family protein [Mycobacterium sp. JS623]